MHPYVKFVPVLYMQLETLINLISHFHRVTLKLYAICGTREKYRRPHSTVTIKICNIDQNIHKTKLFNPGITHILKQFPSDTENRS